MSRAHIWILALAMVGGLAAVAPPSPAAAVVAVRAPRLRVAVVGPVRHVRRGYGDVHVNVDPERAKVFIDGHYVGRGDTTRTLRAGAHVVKVELADGRAAAETVHVGAGRVTRARLELD